MFLPIYLATTAQEFAQFKEIPSTLCYMACHFSSSGSGLSNIPSTLPKGAMLCIDDSTPITNHRGDLIVHQIRGLIEKFQLCGILLDFQRPDNPHTPDMIDCILRHTDCKIAVSHIYANDFLCPVFLPPLPFRMSAEAYLSPWSDREIWLEVGTDKEMAIITDNSFGTEQVYAVPENGAQFYDPFLLCHYSTHIKQDHITVYFHRTIEDIRKLQEKAKGFGVTKYIGLWQQLRQFYS